MIITKPCRSCKCPIGLEQMHESIKRFSNGTFHIQGNCMMCKTFMQWVPYAESRLIKRLISEEYERVENDTKTH